MDFLLLGAARRIIDPSKVLNASCDARFVAEVSLHKLRHELCYDQYRLLIRNIHDWATTQMNCVKRHSTLRGVRSMHFPQNCISPSDAVTRLVRADGAASQFTVDGDAVMGESFAAF